MYPFVRPTTEFIHPLDPFILLPHCIPLLPRNIEFDPSTQCFHPITSLNLFPIPNHWIQLIHSILLSITSIHPFPFFNQLIHPPTQSFHPVTSLLPHYTPFLSPTSEFDPSTQSFHPITYTYTFLISNQIIASIHSNLPSFLPHYNPCLSPTNEFNLNVSLSYLQPNNWIHPLNPFILTPHCIYLPISNHWIPLPHCISIPVSSHWNWPVVSIHYFKPPFERVLNGKRAILNAFYFATMALSVSQNTNQLKLNGWEPLRRIAVFLL